MRWHLAVTSLALVFSSTAASARELPNLDAFASSAVATPRTDPHRPAQLLGVHVLHTEPRLGVPTLLWGNPSGVDPRIRSGLQRMGPEQAARVHLARLAPLYGLTPRMAALAPAFVEEPTAAQGTALVTFRQDVEGIEVFRQSLTVVLNERHELIGMSGYLSPHVAPETRLGRLRFVLDEREAISLAYADLNGERLETTSLRPLGKAEGPYTSFELAPGDRTRYSRQVVAPARVKRVIFPLPDRLVPAWYVELQTGEGSRQDSDSYAYVVAADDGRLLFRHDLTTADVFSYRVWADPSGTFLPQDGPQGLEGSPHPTGSPNGYQAPVVSPSLVMLQNAPFSQNDPWLPSGAAATVGNNVDAYVDISGADGLDGTDFRASTNGSNAFDRVYDVSLEPGASAEQRMASVTQLFYINNFLHDWYYDAGFTEATGNAQSDNYGRGGLSNDSLRAEAQDFSGQNNASMMTPADGARPRLQVFLFTPNTRYGVTVTAPSTIAGNYVAEIASFGPQSFNTTADLIVADDGNGTRTDACQPLINNVAGKIVLIDRNGCTIPIKTKNAQTAGAVGVLIVHNFSGSPLPLTGTDATITIPSLVVSLNDGNLFKAQLTNGPVTVTLLHEYAPARDGAVDNTIVAHEWGHLISNRLIGNGTGLTNNQGRSMGEGWGDFHALLMMVREEDAQLPGNDSFQGAYAIGGYVAGGAAPSGAGNEGFYFGLRRYPYSTDLTRNPLTFKHIQSGVALPTGVPLNPGPAGSSNSEIHNSGEVWATMLWECYTALLRSSPRLTFAQAQERMKRYLVTAYKLTPPLPTFLEARDALLMAAYANDPEDFKLFSAAFARRGAGLRAVAPARESSNHAGVVESFINGKDVLFESAELVEASGSCDNDGVVDNGETGLLRVTLSNTGADTLTATTASVTSSDSGVVIGHGGQITFPSIDPFSSATAEVPVFVTGPSTVRSVHFDIGYRDAQQAIAGDRSASFEDRVNTNEVPASSTTDDAESKQVVWAPSRDLSLGNFSPWQRFSETPVESYFHGPDAPAKADIYLTSPPLVVASTGNFRFTFLHRFSFDSDSVDFYDGGVIELSNDDGATWTDIGSFASPGYIGEISTSVNNPLSGRLAYADISDDYPDWNLETVDLGTAYQGQTVRVRFRIGSDNTISDEGWDIDNVSFTGITNKPFAAVSVDSNTCSNTPPQANGGPDQTVGRGELVTLDGRDSSDADTGSTLSYSWVQTAGPKVTLTDENTAQPTFVAPTVTAETVLSFQLTVSDGRALDVDAVNVTVSLANRAPVANAGPDRTVDERAVITLDGRGSSDPDTGTTLGYSWVQTGGLTVALSGANTAQPSFTAPEVTTNTPLTFELTVSDGMLINSDTVVITVRNVNRAPTANAGLDQTVDERTQVTLDGQGSDPDTGTVLSYFWTQTAGPTATLSDANRAQPIFTAPEVAVATVLTFRLTVSDGVDTDTDTVDITVQNVNLAPQADAGPDQAVLERAQVTLDGRGSSDPDTGTTLSYAWTQTAGPTATLSGVDTAQPTFTVPPVTSDTLLTFQLTVSDGMYSSSDSVNVTVRHNNRAPNVDAGTDQSVVEGSTVTLSGHGADPDGDVLISEWTQTEGPTVALSDAHSPSTTFTAPEVSSTTVLTFKLKVTDPQLLTAEDFVSITVTAKPEPQPDGGTDGGVEGGEGDDSGKGCGCAAGSSNTAAVMPLLLLGLSLMSRRQRSRR